MTRAALAEERRDEIDEWWEGGFLGAVAMASAHEERVRFAFHEDCRRAATRNSIWFIDARPQLICELGGD